jgi:hypothetical protein
MIGIAGDQLTFAVSNKEVIFLDGGMVWRGHSAHIDRVHKSDNDDVGSIM